MRWGELTGLRVRDLDFATRMVTVSRAVAQVRPRFHPDNGRFLVKPYAKGKEYRRFKLSAQITAMLKAHAVERGLDRDDLLFQAPPEEAPRVRVPRSQADPGAPWRPCPEHILRWRPADVRSPGYHRLPMSMAAAMARYPASLGWRWSPES